MQHAVFRLMIQAALVTEEWKTDTELAKKIQPPSVDALENRRYKFYGKPNLSNLLAYASSVLSAFLLLLFF